MAVEYLIRRNKPAGRGIDFAGSLNPEQLRAVQSPPGPALVLAGAGSGKTRTLIYRVAYLLENGVDPGNILLLTFTNKAAREMTTRVTDLLPSDISRIWAGTFHSIGLRLLRRKRARDGAPPINVIDREDQTQLIRTCFQEEGLDPKSKRYPKPDLMADLFSFSINTARSLADVIETRHPYWSDELPAVEKVCARYEEKKREANLVDFDDLLTKTYSFLADDDSEREYYQKLFHFVLVDEYQDTNSIQAELIDLLSARHKNVMVVGDDAQSIYSWRGADFRNILGFQKRYPKAEIYRIETNYRSVPEILDIANAAIGNNTAQFEKSLCAFRPPASSRPARVELMTSRDQGAFVAQRIAELISQGRNPDEIAVLYRSHYHAMDIQIALTGSGIPYRVTSGVRFSEAIHVKDVLAFLRFSINPRDEVAFKRFAQFLPGIGPKAADTLWERADVALRANATPPLGERLANLPTPKKAASEWIQICHLLDELTDPHALPTPGAAIGIVLEAFYDDFAKATFENYHERREDLDAVANFCAEYQTLEEGLAELSLLAGPDPSPTSKAAGHSEPQVSLSSIHQAKGLEWPVVFVVWLTEGSFPSSRSLEDENALEEERRLFYVAITRAMDELYLTWPLTRSGSYGPSLQEPSRFVRELPEHLTVEWAVRTGFF